MPNRFLIACGEKAYEWPFSSDSISHLAYLDKILCMVDRELKDSDLTFLVTSSVDSIPIAGSRAIVFCLGDEMYRTPSYSKQVGLVFKWGSKMPFHPLSLKTPLSSLLEATRAARNTAKRLEMHLHSRSFRPFPIRNLHPIPLGPVCPWIGEVVPLKERKWDVFYAGGVSNLSPSCWKPASWPWRSKDYSRFKLDKHLRHFSKVHQEVKIVHKTAYRDKGARLTPAEYSQQLAQSKICLVPRGNWHETWRFFEAARAGCAVISEPVPDLWYYKDQPAIIVQDWSELEKVVLPILSSPPLLEELHRRSLTWWQETASEVPVAEHVLRVIRKHYGLA